MGIRDEKVNAIGNVTAGLDLAGISITEKTYNLALNQTFSCSDV
jgi:hypothetical protein